MFFDFLNALAQNNNRDWFEKNKPWYESSKKEVEQIVENCIAEISKFQNLGDCTGKNSMFRIYRDVRFSKIKDPYKLNFSALIGHGGKKSKDQYSYYLHFQSNGSFFATGIYEPDKVQLAAIRNEIDFSGMELQAILNSVNFKECFGEIQGSKLKTAPKGYSKEHPLIDLLRLNQLYIMHKIEDSEILKPNFQQYIAELRLKSLPFLNFISKSMA